MKINLFQVLNMKVCLRCGNETVEKGILCPYCLADLERAKNNRGKIENKVINRERNTMRKFRLNEIINSLVCFISLLLI
jgi:uncharacterized membrane protein YvbJ